MFFRNVTGILVMLTTGMLPAFGQMRTGPRNNFSIAGSVREDSTQLMLENIRVDLKSTSSVPVRTALTGSNGEFEITGLGNGDYYIEINANGYEPVRQAVTIFNASARGVSIFLTKPVTILNSKSDGIISAHQLSVPHKAHDEFDKGISLLYGKSDYQGALTQFQRAIKDFPKYYEAYAEEGQAYLRLKQMGPAEEAMKKSIDLSAGQYSDALFMLSALLADLGRYEEAATIARRVIKVDPASWQGPFELARALSGLKQQEEAEKSATQARDMKPDNPLVYLILANIHIQQRNYPALLKDLDAYLKLVPNGPEADQARKTQDQLQAAMQETNKQENPQADAQGGSRTNASPQREKEPPPPDPDSSGLPSLPPPVQDNQ